MSPSGVPAVGTSVHAAAEEGDLVAEPLERHGLDRAVGEHEVDLAAVQQVGLGLEAHPVHAPGQRPAALAGVAEVVEHVVAPDAEVLELDPLAAVRVLHPHVATGPADTVAGAPVMVAGAEVGGRREFEALAVRLDPPLLATEAVVAGDRADGASADDHAGTELAEHGALRIEPGDVVGDAVLGGVERQPPLPEGLDHLEVEGADRHVHPVRRAACVGPHGGVTPAHVDDGEGLRRAEVRVEGEADDDQQLTDLVLAGEPHALVGLGVGCPHDAHRIGRVVDQELVEARERGVLGRGRVGRGAGAPAGARLRGCRHAPAIDVYCEGGRPHR